MFQNDSIVVAAANTDGQKSVIRQHAGQPTPHQVLSWLPRDATPEQQDSAIQMHIKPSEIHWSANPDTLHLPGQTKGKSFRDVSLPQYYRESFFSKDSLFHPELPGGRLGVAGDPVPYTIVGDNFIASLLIGCFILAMIAFANLRQFIVHQAKNFFYVPREESFTISETSNALRFQLFLVLQTCLLSSILYFFYTRHLAGDTFNIENYQMIGVYAGIIAVYFLVKAIAYWTCGLVFFEKKKNGQWIKAFLFMISAEGVSLFPLVMLQTYFDLSTESVLIYVSIVIILFKLLSFYKTYTIFFHRSGAFLQIILYFCALEIIPLLALWGVLTMINSYLKINF